jgi:hypothetical protein
MANPLTASVYLSRANRRIVESRALATHAVDREAHDALLDLAMVLALLKTNVERRQEEGLQYAQQRSRYGSG